MTEDETPIKLCKMWSQMGSDCYEILDMLRKQSHEEMGISDLCDIPIGAAYEYLHVKHHLELKDCARLASELTGIYIWRKHKIIYNFDKTLAEELFAQADEIRNDYQLPTDVLLHPPYPCVCIQLDIDLLDGLPYRSFLAWIEEDANTHAREFRIQPFFPDMDGTNAYVLELTKPTLGECIHDTIATAAKYHDMYKFVLNDEKFDLSIDIVLRAMQLYLYICSDQADVRENLEQRKIYRPRQDGQPIKDKFRELEIKDVGVFVGYTLRRAKAEAVKASHAADEPKQGSHKRPHTRRGHWHHYWTGSKSDPEQRKLILKWTHPMLIGAPTDNVTTINVKE